MKHQKISLVLTISLVIIMGGVALGWDWLRMGGYPYNGSMETAIKVISQQDSIFSVAAGSLKVEILDGSSWQEVSVKVGDTFKGCLFGDANDIQVRKDVVCVWDKTSPLSGNPKPPYKALKVVTEVEYQGRWYRVALYWFKEFCGNYAWNWTEIEKPVVKTPVPGNPTPTPYTPPTYSNPTPTPTPVKKTKKTTLVNLQGVNCKLVGEGDVVVTQETAGGVVLTWGSVNTQSSGNTPTCVPTQNPTCVPPTIIPTPPETPIPPPPTQQPTCMPWPTAQPTLGF